MLEHSSAPFLSIRNSMPLLSLERKQVLSIMTVLLYIWLVYRLEKNISVHTLYNLFTPNAQARKRSRIISA